MTAEEQVREALIAFLSDFSLDTADEEETADRILALARPVAGVVLTPEEVARVGQWHTYAVRCMTQADDALAARLEAESWSVLAEVTPEPDGDMQSPLAHLGDMQSFGPETCSSGVNLTSEEAALAVEALHIGQESLDDYADQFSDVDARLDEGKTRTAAAGMRALAARLEAAQ